MKKVIAIVVLGLLWCNVGFAECIEGNCNNGQGIFSTADGAKYIGEWKDGEPHGKGIAILSNGIKYDGEWKYGAKHGQGVFTWQEGTKYDGGWKDDKEHGQGTITWKSGKDAGSKYVGEWMNGIRNGQGTYTWSLGKFAGDKYVGEFKNDSRNGQGMYIHANGKINNGIWRNGELVERNSVNALTNSQSQALINKGLALAGPDSTQSVPIKGCRCACVNGKMQNLCSSVNDIRNPSCIGICPLAPAKLKPLYNPYKLKPLGTTICSYKQVYNSSTMMYEFRRVCQ